MLFIWTKFIQFKCETIQIEEWKWLKWLEMLYDWLTTYTFVSKSVCKRKKKVILVQRKNKTTTFEPFALFGIVQITASILLSIEYTRVWWFSFHLWQYVITLILLLHFSYWGYRENHRLHRHLPLCAHTNTSLFIRHFLLLFWIRSFLLLAFCSMKDNEMQ